MNLRLVERWLQWSPFRGSGSACKFIRVSLLFAVQPPLHFKFPVVIHSVRKTLRELQTALYDIHRCLAKDRVNGPFFQRMLVVDVLIYFEFKCVSPTNVPNKLIYWYITNSPYVGGCYNLSSPLKTPAPTCIATGEEQSWCDSEGRDLQPLTQPVLIMKTQTAISNLESPRNHPPKKVIWNEGKPCIKRMEKHLKATKSHEKPC